MLKSVTHKRSISALLLTTSLFCLSQPSLPAQAQESTSPVSKETDRLGLGLIGSLNLLTPSLGAELSYRPPILEDRLRIFAQYDFLTFSSLNPRSVGAWLGLRHDFYHNPELLNLRSYGQLRLGAVLGTVPGPNNTVMASGVWIPAVDFGIGAELQVAGPLWAFAQIAAGLPILLRTEAGLRVAF